MLSYFISKQRLIMINNLFKLSIPIILLIIFSFYITSKFIQEPVKKELTIAAGSKNGEYYKIALQYKELLKKEKVKLNIIETNGSIENLELLKNKKVDLAFIQNGIKKLKKLKNISSLGNIYYEPLWVFYKNENYQVSYLVEFTSKKISIGLKNSGSNDLSLRLLNDNGINKNNSTLLNLSNENAYKKLKDGTIDVMFFVASLNSKLVHRLLEDPNIHILNIKRARAYSSKYEFIENLNLFEGTIDLYKNIPYDNVKLLSTSANIITNDYVPDELIRLLLKQIKYVHEKKSLLSRDDVFPNIKNINMKIHEEAKRYYENGDSFLEKIFPFWIASNIDRLKILLIPLLTLFFPLAKGFFPLYTWTMRSKIYKWYKKLKEYDNNIESLEIKELNDTLLLLQHLKNEIEKETSVPPAFMGEYYNLILHIDLISNKIKEKINIK